MSFRVFSFLFLLQLVLLGCAPETSSDQKTDALRTQPALPERPTQQPTAIFNRDLLFQNDARISYCEIVENHTATYSGMRDMRLEPLASLSKMVTTAWALEQMGADFRFASEIYLNPVQADGIYDVYLKTNYDPIVNIEKLLYFIVRMHVQGVRQIRHLVVDESTRIYLGVLSNPHIELENTPVSIAETLENLQLIFNSKNWAEKTKIAKSNLLEWAGKNKKSIHVPEQFSVGTVSYKASSAISTKSYASKIVISSAPLFRYLKNMNVYSNNYIADALFARLGGAQRFKSFQINQLNLTEQHLQLHTGSGLADVSKGLRQDNLGTCFSMLRVLGFLKNKADTAQLNLGNLLLNPSSDKGGTFETESNYQNAAVLKTGRLYEVSALNLAGFVSTTQGLVSFAFLGHDFDATSAPDIEKKRSQMLNDLFVQHPVQSDFSSLEHSTIFF